MSGPTFNRQVSFAQVQKNLANKWWTIVPGEKVLPLLDAAIHRYQSACAAFEQAQEALERAKQAVADARIDIGRALENEP